MPYFKATPFIFDIKRFCHDEKIIIPQKSKMSFDLTALDTMVAFEGHEYAAEHFNAPGTYEATLPPKVIVMEYVEEDKEEETCGMCGSAKEDLKDTGNSICFICAECIEDTPEMNFCDGCHRYEETDDHNLCGKCQSMNENI